MCIQAGRYLFEIKDKQYIKKIESYNHYIDILKELLKKENTTLCIAKRIGDLK